MITLVYIIALQVIGESLPISSSGHYLLGQLIARQYGLVLPLLSEEFDFLLHITACVIIASFFFSTWWPLLRAVVRKKSAQQVFVHLVSFTVIAGTITCLFYPAKKIFTPYTALLLPYGFAGTVCVLGLLYCYERRIKHGTWITPRMTRMTVIFGTKSLLLGLVQGIALLLPGLSRFAVVYSTARWLGYAPRRAFQVCFLIQFPLISAAVLFKGLPALMHAEFRTQVLHASVLLALAGSTLIAAFFFAVVYRLALRKRLWLFGIYEVIPLMLSLLYTCGMLK